MKLLLAGLMCVALALTVHASYLPRLRRQADDRWSWGEPATRRTTTTTTTAAPAIPDADVLRRCMTACLTTSEYDPMCGTNRQTYSNTGRLTCAQNCGVDVQLLFRGSCEPFG